MTSVHKEVGPILSMNVKVNNTLKLGVHRTVSVHSHGRGAKSWTGCKVG